MQHDTIATHHDRESLIKETIAHTTEEEEVRADTREEPHESLYSEHAPPAPVHAALPVYQEDTTTTGKMRLEPVAEEEVVSVEVTEQHFTPRGSPTAEE